MRITANGNVGIGTTSPAQKLDIAGNIRCVALTQTSDRRYKTPDRRYKTSFTPIPSSLEKISALNGVYFNWDTKKYP